MKDWYLHIFAKHAFNKVALKPLHHLENYIFSKNFEMIQNIVPLTPTLIVVILLFYLRLAKYLTMIIEAFLQMMKKKSQ